MLNHITIMGRLTRDPELRHTQAQTPVASFSLAVDRDFGGRDGGEKQTDFIDCVAWRQTGEFVQRYFQRGSMAVVSGRLQSRKWQDRDGNSRTSWEVVVDNIYFGESKKDSGTYNRDTYNRDNGGYAPKNQSAPAAPAPKGDSWDDGGFGDMDVSDGELPF